MRKHPPLPEPDVPPSTDNFVSQHAIQHMREIRAELAERRLESLKLYRAMSHQEEFHKCMASERIVLGGNRGGKSLAVAVEAARAVTGQDPYGKYPKADGNLAIVGRNWPHIGLVIYPILFKAGAFHHRLPIERKAEA